MVYNKKELLEMLKGSLEICEAKGITTLRQWENFEEELRINE